MSHATEPLEPPVASPSASRAPGIITARGIVKHYMMGDTQVSVLKGADLDVKAGEFIAIEGRSGSGKSTLLHILAGLDAADAGTIHAGEVEIGAMAAAVDRGRRFTRSVLNWDLFKPLVPLRILLFALFWIPGILFGWLFVGLMNLLLVIVTSEQDHELSRIRNKHFGFVFQFYHLLPELDVLENTMLAPMVGKRRGVTRRQRRERAEALLKQFGLEHRLHHLPSQLSGGERQRVAIARALMNEPKVLFADEPTGNLDSVTGRQIMDVLEQLHRETGQTIVMVTHDRTLAREADRVLVLQDGKLEPAGAG